MNGVAKTINGKITVCRITELSDELKNLIRSELSALCHGKAQIEDNEYGYYSYSRTVKKFVNTLNGLSSTQRVGVVGELIAHILIGNDKPHFSTVTLMTNKEEEQIHKGFDLIYISDTNSSLWYGETKSGELNLTQTSTQKNRDLLNAAKRGLADYLTGTRDKLWDSALIEAKLALKSESAATAKKLLQNDLLQLQSGQDIEKNALLVSILFHDVNNPFDDDDITLYLQGLESEALFTDILLYCIQKSTYSKIIDFLNSEADVV